MEMHPVLDQIFNYGSKQSKGFNGTGIHQMLKDYEMAELKEIWALDLTYETKRRFIKAHKGNDFHTVLRILCNKSIMQISEEARAVQTPDRRR